MEKKKILYDGSIQLKGLNIQSVPVSYKRVNDMFDRGGRENLIAQVIMMSFHYRPHFCICGYVCASAHDHVGHFVLTAVSSFLYFTYCLKQTDSETTCDHDLHMETVLKLVF